jgi:long-chain acyl-CoA synthetase
MIDLRPKTRIKHIIYTSIGDYLPFPKSILFPLAAKKKRLACKVKSAEDLHKWKELIKKYPPAPPDVDISWEDTAMCQYTGGTTGITKGAILTHRNLSTQVQVLELWFKNFNRGEENILGALPFFHAFGLTSSMNLAVYMGWGNILVAKPHPDALLKNTAKYRPTFAAFVPAMYIGILNHPDLQKYDLSSISACFSGSAPLPVEIIRGFEKVTGATIVEGYGLTESSPITHINPLLGKRKVGSIGIPIPDTQCRITDIEDKKKVLAGQDGR